MIRVDVEHLHRVLEGDSRVRGKTVANLVIALQLSDFISENVTIVGMNGDHLRELQRLFRELAEGMDYTVIPIRAGVFAVGQCYYTFVAAQHASVGLAGGPVLEDNALDGVGRSARGRVLPPMTSDAFLDRVTAATLATIPKRRPVPLRPVVSRPKKG